MVYYAYLCFNPYIASAELSNASRSLRAHRIDSLTCLLCHMPATWRVLNNILFLVFRLLLMRRSTTEVD